jgi:acyl carrier protein
MKEKIRELLEDRLPLVDFDSEFLFSELDSLGITTILMTLADEFGIRLEASDATPKPSEKGKSARDQKYLKAEKTEKNF